MSGDPVTMALLFDFYGERLTERQREFFDLYHNQDLSLSEIAELAGISRQGVRDALTRGELLLRETESQLRLVERFSALQTLLSGIREAADKITAANERYGGNMYVHAHAQDIRERVAQCEALFNDE